MEVLDAFNFLFDDGACIEVGSDVVAGGANEFDSAFVGLAVWVGSDECWKKRVVDVDDLAAEFLAEPIGEDLHESGEDGEFDFLFDEKFSNLLKTIGFFIAIHFYMMEWDTGVFGNGLTGFTVADDGGDFDWHFT